AIWDREPPAPEPSPEKKAEIRRLDLHARLEMRVKLIQLEKHNLQLALRYLEQTYDRGGMAASGDRLELFLRYATTARREFYRTLNSFIELKDKRI
ncbi:MAG: hypothetical protein WAM58_05310, partial [Candidatus Acidiferrum sp.]